MFAEKTSVVIAGGNDNVEYSGVKDVEILNHDESCNIPNLPLEIFASSMFQHQKEILLCGGVQKSNDHAIECFKLQNDAWTPLNSSLNYVHNYASVISMTKGTYLLGGWLYNSLSSEILAHDKDTWQVGPHIPEPGLEKGCGVRISDNEFMIIGGEGSKTQVLKYALDDNRWYKTSVQLIEEREQHCCIVFNGKVIVTGGFVKPNVLSSTEIIDLSKYSYSFSK